MEIDILDTSNLIQELIGLYNVHVESAYEWVHDSWIADAFSMRPNQVSLFRNGLKQASAQARYRAGRRLLRGTVLPWTELRKGCRSSLLGLHLLSIDEASRAAVLAGALGNVGVLKRLISSVDLNRFESVAGIAIDTFLNVVDTEDDHAYRVLYAQREASAGRNQFDTDVLAIEGLCILGALDDGSSYYRAALSRTLPMAKCEIVATGTPLEIDRIIESDEVATARAAVWAVVQRCMPEVRCLFG